MSEILQTNIFFIITSVGIIILTILVSLILYQVLKIVKSVRRLVSKIEAGSDLIAEDVSQLRAFVLEGTLVSQLLRFFMPSSRRKRKSREDDEE
ncbi:hypothetical protein KC845_03255 [Candidatus Kaiserbacteria bacterium]|nr:hypothetical protein [Candidatus Kaiserbacteria bacterium]